MCTIPSYLMIFHSIILTITTQAADTSLPKIQKKAGYEPKYDWVIHDPSRVITKGKTQMIAVTGKAQEDGYDCGLETWWRKKNHKGKWKPGQCLLRNKPNWIQELTNNDGAYWAPELFNSNVMLYSISEFDSDKPTTCVGILNGNGKFPNKMTWKDAGKPIFCIIGADYDEERSAIDPSIFKGFDGKTYLVTGGGVIIGTELDNDYMPKSGNWFSLNDPTWKELARGPDLEDDRWVEAAYIIPKEIGSKKYYYLFVNWHACCSGTNSTYEIHVGRSTNPLGPFIDEDGIDLREEGGTLFLKKESYMIGPGHMGHYTKKKGKTDIMEIMTFHYYDKRREDGNAWIGERELKWDNNGWPIAGKLLSSYQYRQK